MLRLILMRHAKSSWDDRSIADFDRPLNKRGMKNAPEMGKFLHSSGIRVDLALCSSAKRTRQTLELLSEQLHVAEVKFCLEMYEATMGTVLSLVQEQGNRSALLLVGHNPWISYLAMYLSKTMVEEFPTAGVLCLDFQLAEWKDIQPKSGQIVFKKFPKEL